MGGIRLIVRPIGMPVRAVVPRKVDHRTDAGDVGEGAEQLFDGAHDAFIRDIGCERLIVVDDPGNRLHTGGGESVALGAHCLGFGISFFGPDLVRRRCSPGPVTRSAGMTPSTTE